MTTATLTIHERDELAGCEQMIERGLRTCQALLTIRDSRLYRVEHTTFEDYCRERWEMTPQHGGRLIAAAEVAGALEPNGGSMPRTEGVARELTPLRSDPDAQRAAWSQTIDLHGAQPTAAQTREVVDVVRDLPPQQRSVDHVAQALRTKPQPDMRFMHVNEAARNLSQARAHSASRRLASSLLRDTEQPDGDEQTASLFDATRYRPPRCVTILDQSGELRHKAIEHATVPDCDAYESVLEENIGRAQRRFRAFRDEIAADLAAHGTIGAALRARRDTRAA